MQTQRVKCPRCSRWWVAYAGEGEMACNCHTYCEDGDKPSDCIITADSWTGQLAWPVGMHGGERLGPPPAENPMRRYSYCSVHNKFIVAPPIVFPVEWKTFYAHRAKKESRFNRGV